jgi:hypothetical protein
MKDLWLRVVDVPGWLFKQSCWQTLQSPMTPQRAPTETNCWSTTPLSELRAHREALEAGTWRWPRIYDKERCQLLSTVGPASLRSWASKLLLTVPFCPGHCLNTYHITTEKLGSGMAYRPSATLRRAACVSAKGFVQLPITTHTFHRQDLPTESALDNGSSRPTTSPRHPHGVHQPGIIRSTAYVHSPNAGAERKRRIAWWPMRIKKWSFVIVGLGASRGLEAILLKLSVLWAREIRSPLIDRTHSRMVKGAFRL